MLLFIVLTVFLAGLMVGRTPEYLGKKIEAKEVKLAGADTARDADRRASLSQPSPLRPGNAQTSVQDAGPTACPN